ncbi:5'-deoxynucleotidase [Guyparkeria hydrothermalis]|uniref:5'-deoxynucleotidase n=1 Tax=Guyparkeria halophila TaxID=47960 RepID=A0A6I6D0Z2_9GAMM|nr:MULTISPECIES: 5'-deoxynucleotidase [Guyparkeria]MCL7750943.1 5'-deoxynucleotidase [Guyparkeria hydrothermalis]QGT77404.1 5'-deoxynucleotidase [Guyparkeria halophila]
MNDSDQSPEKSHFFAYLSRMKYIYRWGLMRNTRSENVQEHSLQVAMIAHALAVIGNQEFGEANDVGRVVSVALYHDASEIITGDLPTPVKYFREDIRDSYKALEAHAERKIIGLLPESLQESFAEVIESARIEPGVLRLVKAADSLSAYLKCIEERAAGNQEFRRAEEFLQGKLDEMTDLPAVGFFRERFVDAFELTLDDLSHD